MPAGAENHPEPAADQRLIVGDHHARRRGCGSLTGLLPLSRVGRCPPPRRRVAGAAEQVDREASADHPSTADAAVRRPARRRIARSARAVRSGLAWHRLVPRAQPRGSAARCRPPPPRVGRRRRRASRSWVGFPACLSTFVSASWTTRNTARSSPGDSSWGRSPTRRSIGSPAAVNRSTSACSWARPGCGSSSAGAAPPGVARVLARRLHRAEQSEKMTELGHRRAAARLHGQHRRPGLAGSPRRAPAGRRRPARS